MAHRLNVQPLKVEQDNETESWRKFLRRFEVAVLSVDFEAKLTQEGDAKTIEGSRRKAGALLGCLGEEGMVIFDTFDIAVEAIQYDALKTRFDNHFQGRENKTILRHRFLCMTQESGESLSVFSQRVIQLSRQCQLGDLREDLAIHMIIKGMREEKLKTEMLRMADITMNDLVAACAKFEAAERTVVAF